MNTCAGVALWILGCSIIGMYLLYLGLLWNPHITLGAIAVLSVFAGLYLVIKGDE